MSSSIEQQLTRAQDPAAASAADAAHSPPPPLRRERTYIRPRRGWQAVDFGELWRSRELLWQFTVRDVQVRYKQTFFGYAWAIIVPVVQVLVFSIIFGNVLGVNERVDEAAGRPLPYPLFLLTGQIVWNFFRMTVDGAGMSLVSNAGIIRKIYVPRLVLPFSTVGKPAVDTAVVSLLMIGLLAWYAGHPQFDVWLTPKLLLAPLLLAGAVLPALGVGLIVAAVTVGYRDLRYVVPIAIQILFYVTPVLYPVEVLGGYGWLAYLNPIAGFVQAHRAAVIDLPIDWLGLMISTGISVVLFAFGLFYFARTERQFADVA